MMMMLSSISYYVKVRQSSFDHRVLKLTEMIWLAECYCYFLRAFFSTNALRFSLCSVLGQLHVLDSE